MPSTAITASSPCPAGQTASCRQPNCCRARLSSREGPHPLVNAGDAHFADLRLWRDLNQDGISLTGELFTLESLGIAALMVARTDHTRTPPNCNQLADLGGYLKTDGSSGTLGEVTAELGDINLAGNPFYILRFERCNPMVWVCLTVRSEGFLCRLRLVPLRSGSLLTSARRTSSGAVLTSVKVSARRHATQQRRLRVQWRQLLRAYAGMLIWVNTSRSARAQASATARQQDQALD